MSLKAKKPSLGKSKRTEVHKNRADVLEDVKEEPVKRFNGLVPASKYKAFRKKCLEEDVSMNSLLNEWIDLYLMK